MKFETGSPSNAWRMVSCWNDDCEAPRMNMPISAHHSPPMKLPLNRLNRPSRIRKKPKEEPMADVMPVACRRLLPDFHKMPRNTRPPSSGNAGIMLNKARTTLMNARYSRTPVTARPPP